jgi:conjugative transfer signal peptidase TraF
MNSKTLKIISLSALLLMIFLYGLSSYFVIQLSDSLPQGLYIKKSVPETISLGQLVLIEIPSDIKAMMINRQWIPSHVKYYLMKPVAAIAGDHIKVDSQGVFVNKKFKGTIQKRDQQGHKLPKFHYNGLLKENLYFVMASARNSFDSRYFGPVHKQSIINIVEPFMTFSREHHE